MAFRVARLALAAAAVLAVMPAAEGLSCFVSGGSGGEGNASPMNGSLDSVCVRYCASCSVSEASLAFCTEEQRRANSTIPIFEQGDASLLRRREGAGVTFFSSCRCVALNPRARRRGQLP